MTRPSALTMVMVAALLLAGCASLLAYKFLKSQGSVEQKGLAVVAAKADIPIGSNLDLSQMKLAYYPKEALPPGYHTEPRSLTGRIAVRHISAGDIITETKLMPQSAAATGGVMTYIVPRGHRAVTVAVNEVAGVAGFITPNSRVDVVLTTPLPGKTDFNNVEDNISKVFLQNVPVLACGQVTEQKDGKPVVVPTVTLDLLPDDAEKLIVGAKKGALQLLLRNMVDVATVSTGGSTVSKALGRTEQPAALALHHRAAVKVAAPRTVAKVVQQPAAAPKFTVEVLRGAVKSTREFSQEF